MKANYSKSEELIRDVIDEYENMELNIASPVAREMLTGHIHSKLSKHFYIFKKNELIVKDE